MDNAFCTRLVPAAIGFATTKATLRVDEKKPPGRRLLWSVRTVSDVAYNSSFFVTIVNVVFVTIVNLQLPPQVRAGEEALATRFRAGYEGVQV